MNFDTWKPRFMAFKFCGIQHELDVRTHNVFNHYKTSIISIMNNVSSVSLVQKALKLINDIEDDNKNQGLVILRDVLQKNDRQLVALGYDQLIFKELIKMLQFENGSCLEIVLELLELNYFANSECLDELAEQLIYKVAKSADSNTSKICLEKISSLIDAFDDRIAKHSKQLLKLADLTDDPNLSPILSKILSKMEAKLPKRKSDPLSGPVNIN